MRPIERFVWAFLMAGMLAACLGCGGGGGPTDKTAPTITSVTVSPAAFDYHGGSATVTVVASDNATSASAIQVSASLVEPGSGSVVSGPVALPFLSGEEHAGSITVPPNPTAQARTYTVRVTARDADKNVRRDESQSVSVSGLVSPPPPPS